MDAHCASVLPRADMDTCCNTECISTPCRRPFKNPDSPQKAELLHTKSLTSYEACQWGGQALLAANRTRNPHTSSQMSSPQVTHCSQLHLSTAHCDCETVNEDKKGSADCALPAEEGAVGAQLVSEKEHRRVRLLWFECPLHSRTKTQALMGRDQAEKLARALKVCGVPHRRVNQWRPAAPRRTARWLRWFLSYLN